jgi:hypothetical protein
MKTDSLYLVALKLLAFKGPLLVLMIISVLKSYSSLEGASSPTLIIWSEAPTALLPALPF